MRKTQSEQRSPIDSKNTPPRANGPAADVVIVNLGTGFFIIAGESEKGKHWVNLCIAGAEDGIAYTDDSRLAGEIYEAAQAEGLTVEARRET